MMEAQNPIRLLIADVDGTLVTQEKVLTEQTVAAVKALRDAGIGFAITSGRPPRGMQMLIAPLDLQTPVAGFNGGVFTKPDLSSIEIRALPLTAARDAVDLILRQGLDVWVYTADQWLVRDKAAAHVARETWTVKFEPTQVDSFTDGHLSHAVKIVGVSDDNAMVAATEQQAQNLLGSQVSAARSQPYYLDITHPDANKGEVVMQLSRWLDIPPAQIATIGDMPNDVLMFRRGGVSIAMGNASDEVKAQATHVTAGNGDEGFAKAVHSFVLPAAVPSQSGSIAGSVQ